MTKRQQRAIELAERLRAAGIEADAEAGRVSVPGVTIGAPARAGGAWVVVAVSRAPEPWRLPHGRDTDPLRLLESHVDSLADQWRTEHAERGRRVIEAQRQQHAAARAVERLDALGASLAALMRGER